MKTSSEALSSAFFVIAYGQPQILRNCLDRLVRYIPIAQITVIDNHSPESLQAVAQNFGIRYIRMKANSGYAGACNKAVKEFLKQKEEFLCVMNSDVFIDSKFTKSLRQILQEASDDPSIGLFQPALYFNSSYTRVENVGIAYYASGLAFQASRNSAQTLCNGACMFVRKSAIEFLQRQDGYVFEEMFWSYAEDVEISLRLRSTGWKTCVYGNLKAVHLQSASFGRRSVQSLFLYARNLLWILLMTRTRRQWIFHFPFIIIGQLRICIQFLLHGRPDTYLRLLLETYKQKEKLIHKRIQWREKQMVDVTSTYQLGAFPLMW